MSLCSLYSNRFVVFSPKYFEQNNDPDADLKDELPHLSLEQVELSMQRIVNLCRNGNAFITNIKVACDARENLRRLEEDELTLLRSQKQDIEEKKAEKMFKEIQAKWKKSPAMKIPHELHDVSGGLTAFFVLAKRIRV